MRVIKFIYGLMFFLGLFLLALNIIGVLIPLWNPEIYFEQTIFDNDLTLSKSDFYQIISKRNISDEEYIIKATIAVNNAIAHYWDQAGVEKYNLGVPLHENYILHTINHIYRSDKRYEFCNYHKAVERGAGLCSQQALILDSILKEQGIQSKIIEFPWLHVLGTAQVIKEEDSWWVIDPDYGVIIPHDIDFIHQNPEIIHDFYAQAGYGEDTTNNLIKIFSSPYRLHDSTEHYLGLEYCKFEQYSYITIWVIPIIFLVIGPLPYVRNLRSSRPLP
jgi:hypothetical protein